MSYYLYTININFFPASIFKKLKKIPYQPIKNKLNSNTLSSLKINFNPSIRGFFYRKSLFDFKNLTNLFTLTSFKISRRVRDWRRQFITYKRIKVTRLGYQNNFQVWRFVSILRQKRRNFRWKIKRSKYKKFKFKNKSQRLKLNLYIKPRLIPHRIRKFNRVGSKQNTYRSPIQSCLPTPNPSSNPIKINIKKQDERSNINNRLRIINFWLGLSSILNIRLPNLFSGYLFTKKTTPNIVATRLTAATNLISYSPVEYTNLNMPRIKFNPGYMRLWRRFRSKFAQERGLNFRYQHRLTAYITKQARFFDMRFYSQKTISILSVFQNSRFVTNFNDFEYLLDNRLLFLNGGAVYNRHTLLVPGDFIQMIITYKFYIFKKYSSLYDYKKIAKYRFKWFKAPKKHKSRVLFKYNNDGWLKFYYGYMDLNLSKTFEYDWFTLAILYIKTPLLKDIDYVTRVWDSKFNAYRLYNWKYLT